MFIPTLALWAIIVLAVGLVAVCGFCAIQARSIAERGRVDRNQIERDTLNSCRRAHDAGLSMAKATASHNPETRCTPDSPLG